MTGNVKATFGQAVQEAKDFHRKYPNEPVENLERRYRKKAGPDMEQQLADVDRMFSGEEAYGRFMDMVGLHEQYSNLPGVKNARRSNYIKYLDEFDRFVPPFYPMSRSEKLSNEYFQYVTALADHLESFIRRNRPLQNIDKTLRESEAEFEEAWNDNQIPQWAPQKTARDEPKGEDEDDEMTDPLYCKACDKQFTNPSVFDSHLSGKKHKKNAGTATNKNSSNQTLNGVNGTMTDLSNALPTGNRLQERAIAEREYRTKKLAGELKHERAETKTNVERRQGMTEREREQELEAVMAERAAPAGEADEGGNEEDGEEKIYNPLKLPLAWDGKPIPYWLYKLHGLGNEFKCQICGEFTYMGRRAFDKHFTEPRHTWGLKALGIKNSNLFREITTIDDAVKLSEKIEKERKFEAGEGDVVEMEDSSGHVMPEKVYHDLQKQGLV